MTSDQSRKVARKLREVADLIETHDLADLITHPDLYGEVSAFVGTEADLLAGAARLGVEADLPLYVGDHGHARKGPLTLTWIPKTATAVVRRLREENAALKKLVAEVGA